MTGWYWPLRAITPFGRWLRRLHLGWLLHWRYRHRLDVSSDADRLRQFLPALYYASWPLRQSCPVDRLPELSLPAWHSANLGLALPITPYQIPMNHPRDFMPAAVWPIASECVALRHKEEES